MARAAGIGFQDFEQIIVEGNFYVDKTMFIREWWERKDRVTLKMNTILLCRRRM